MTPNHLVGATSFICIVTCKYITQSNISITQNQTETETNHVQYGSSFLTYYNKKWGLGEVTVYFQLAFGTHFSGLCHCEEVAIVDRLK